MTTTNPIIVHIANLLEQANPEQLRIIYQVVRAIVRPHGNHNTTENLVQ